MLVSFLCVQEDQSHGFGVCVSQNVAVIFNWKMVTDAGLLIVISFSPSSTSLVASSLSKGSLRLMNASGKGSTAILPERISVIAPMR